MSLRVAKSHGFSMLETVIVLFLAGLMLGAVSLLTRETLNTLKFMQEKGDTAQSATLGCERLCSEMREMVAAPGGLGAGITFVKVNPNSAAAIGNPVASPLPPIVPPLTHNWIRVYPGLVTISYTQSGTDLERRVNGGNLTLVGTNVNGLAITQVSTGNFRVSLTIQENRRLATFVNFVSCPGVPRP